MTDLAPKFATQEAMLLQRCRLFYITLWGQVLYSHMAWPPCGYPLAGCKFGFNV